MVSSSFGKPCQQLTPGPLPHLSGRWPVLLLLYIWSETELSKKHWVVWDISRGLQARQHCAAQTFVLLKTCLEFPRSLYWTPTVSPYNIHNSCQTLANSTQPLMLCDCSPASFFWTWLGGDIVIEHICG